ncbi:Arm DNA-binding domain-containing protein [Metabacillus sediminilitoris]|uniref:AP2-like integrase N-terminal domain-containing protein n=1 Tax=Metabacillus sediminilitoris TaxID=2567941 RepID=A0A4S4C1S5_9BACI|nr:hypothetical protein GMB29_24280 [Metabacillus sediminilitoris]THF81610.1 hypothetical protein E6W99_06425 [Metabacillus sediminilitoris]
MPKQKRSGFKTKKEAQKATAKLIYDLEQGIYYKESYLPFEKFTWD